MSKKYDVIVIGAGLNGLVAATALAKRGRRVVTLEKTAEVGGLAAGHEFHPGFRSAGVLHDTTGFRPWVVEQLELRKYGLKLRGEEVPVFAPAKTGPGLLIWRGAERAQEELAPLAAADAKAYRDYRAFIQRAGSFLAKVFDDFPPDVASMSFPGVWDIMKKAVSLRLLGKSDMMEILRIAPMCVADWLNEYFATDLLKAALAAPSIYNSFTGPWSPGTNMNLLMSEAFCQNPVAGGPAALARALEAAAKAAGVEIRTGAEVRRVELDGRRVKGVTLADGSQLEAERVAAACDPKQLFLKLLEPSHLTMKFEANIRNIRARGTTAKVNLAVSAYPELVGRPSLKAEVVRTGGTFDHMERAFDAVKYGEIAKEPVLDVYVPTVEDPTLAPSGQHVLSILVHFAPYAVKGGWSAARKDELFANTTATLAQYMPGLPSLIVGQEVLTPADLEQRFNLTGGQLFHGEHAADQLLVRPTPECSRYATPYEGLYLCGSGAHPGGGLTGAPGAFAAKAING